MVYRPRNATSFVDETVPKNCHNGTFWWNYPQGTINLHFSNSNGLSMSVCLRDYLGGDIFTIHDVTNGQFIPLEINDRRIHSQVDLKGNLHALFLCFVLDLYGIT